MYLSPTAAEAAQRYTASTVHPVNLLVHAHNGMIAKLNDAKLAIQENRIEDRLNITNKITSVIDVLQMSLDREQNIDTAKNLDRLYTYFCLRLVEINIKNDAYICDELIARISELRNAWQAILVGDVDAEPAWDKNTSLSA